MHGVHFSACFWAAKPLKSTNLYKKRLLLFSGKGGVGKTTVSSAFALSCARRGEKTLLIELNVHDKVSSMFGAGRVGTEITEVEDNLWAVNITPEAALEEYAVMMLKVRIVYKAVFENRIMKSFLRAIPGLNELVMLGKAYYHVVEKENGKHVWDKIVVDAPATGHGLFLLKIPMVITSILSSGHMFEEAERIIEVLRDPEITALNLVTLAEEMPVNETIMLHNQTRDELKIPMGAVIANGVYEPLFSESEHEILNAAAKHVKEPSVLAMIDAANFRVMRTRLQAGYLKEIDREIPLPRHTLPFVFTPRMDFQSLLTLAEELESEIEGGQS